MLGGGGLQKGNLVFKCCTKSGKRERRIREQEKTCYLVFPSRVGLLAASLIMSRKALVSLSLKYLVVGSFWSTKYRPTIKFPFLCPLFFVPSLHISHNKTYISWMILSGNNVFFYIRHLDWKLTTCYTLIKNFKKIKKLKKLSK